METLTEERIQKDTNLPAKKKSWREFFARLGLSLLCIFLSAAAVIPFFFLGRSRSPGKFELRMPVTHDMTLHFEQMKSFYNGLAAGKIFPRWEEDTNRGLGAPTTSYYPPGIYYITSAFYWISRDWWWTILLTHLLLMIASAAAMFVYVRQYASRKVAAVAMTAYIFFPYHIVDQYQRGALAELAGFIWMPLLLLFGERLFKRSGRHRECRGRTSTLWSVAGLAASYGAFLWAHPPTAYQFSLAFGLYLLGLAFFRKDLKGLILCGCGIALGCMLSAVYLYVAAAENNLISHEYLETSFPYQGTYIFNHHLPWVPDDYGFFWLLNSLWIIGVATLTSCALSFLVFGRRGAKAETRERAVLYFAVGCFAGFMMLKFSDPIGRHLPEITIGVFSWRMLGILTLACALFAGLCAQIAFSNRRKKVTRIAFGVLAFLALAGNIAATVSIVIVPMAHAPFLVQFDEHINIATIPHDVTDEWSEVPPLERATLASQKGEVTVEKWLPESRILRVKAEAPDTLRIRTFNFPGWTAMVNGNPAQITTGKIYYEINVAVPAGESTVTLEYQDTPVRLRGKRITQFAFVIMLALTVAPFVKRRRKHEWT